MPVTYIQYGLAHASSSDGLIFLARLASFPASLSRRDRSGTAGFCVFRRTNSLPCTMGLRRSSRIECLRPLAMNEGQGGVYPRTLRRRGGHEDVTLGVLSAFSYALERR